MSDFYRYLPLSGREHGDESDVSADWRPRIAQTLAQMTGAMRSQPVEAWARPTLRTTRGGHPESVHDVLNDLGQRLTSSRLGLIVPRTAPTRTAGEILELLDQMAARAASGGGRSGLGDLDAVVVACYDVCFALTLADPTDPRGSGAVALGRATAAPTPLRGVIADRTLTATDAGWQIGRGPAIRGSAMLLVLWLAGRPLRPQFD